MDRGANDAPLFYDWGARLQRPSNRYSLQVNLPRVDSIGWVEIEFAVAAFFTLAL